MRRPGTAPSPYPDQASHSKRAEQRRSPNSLERARQGSVDLRSASPPQGAKRTLLPTLTGHARRGRHAARLEGNLGRREGDDAVSGWRHPLTPTRPPTPNGQSSGVLRTPSSAPDRGASTSGRHRPRRGRNAHYSPPSWDTLNGDVTLPDWRGTLEGVRGMRRPGTAPSPYPDQASHSKRAEQRRSPNSLERARQGSVDLRSASPPQGAKRALLPTLTGHARRGRHAARLEGNLGRREGDDAVSGWRHPLTPTRPPTPNGQSSGVLRTPSSAPDRGASTSGRHRPRRGRNAHYSPPSWDTLNGDVTLPDWRGTLEGVRGMRRPGTAPSPYPDQASHSKRAEQRCSPNSLERARQGSADLRSASPPQGAKRALLPTLTGRTKRGRHAARLEGNLGRREGDGAVSGWRIS